MEPVHQLDILATAQGREAAHAKVGRGGHAQARAMDVAVMFGSDIASLVGSAGVGAVVAPVVDADGIGARVDLACTQTSSQTSSQRDFRARKAKRRSLGAPLVSYVFCGCGGTQRSPETLAVELPAHLVSLPLATIAP